MLRDLQRATVTGWKIAAIGNRVNIYKGMLEYLDMLNMYFRFSGVRCYNLAEQHFNSG